LIGCYILVAMRRYLVSVLISLACPLFGPGLLLLCLFNFGIIMVSYTNLNLDIVAVVKLYISYK